MTHMRTSVREKDSSHIPKFYGAGIVQEVYDEEETYLSAPGLYEAGSLNYTGIVAMVKAIEILEKTGYDSIQEHEQSLLRKVIDGLSSAWSCFEN